MNSNLVSVIVASYNYGHFIGEALDSLIEQTHRNWECLVVDDGSTDNTAEVVQKYLRREPRIQYIRQENQGAAAARNNGLKHAKGSFFQFLDADDLLEPKKLEIHVNFLVQNSQIDICYGSAQYFPNDNPSERWFCLTELGKPWLIEITPSDDVLAIFVNNNIPVNTALIRRRVIERVGNFDISIKFVEDWDFWFRCAKTGLSFQYVAAENTLALIRSHRTSITQTSVRRLEQLGHITLMRKKFAQSLLSQPKLQQLNQVYLADNVGGFGIAEVEDRRIQSGYKLMLRAAAMNSGINPRVKWLVAANLSPFISAARLREFMKKSLKDFIVDSWKKNVKIQKN